jgi:hypothetical protein
MARKPAKNCIILVDKQLFFPFIGNWLVNYDPKEFNYPDILINLAQIQDYFKKNSINFNSINVNFNKNRIKNYFYKENGDIYLSFCAINKVFAVKNTKPCEPAGFKPQKNPIKSISLLFPRQESDPRWKSMGLPAGQLFLASNLSASGFEATPLPLTLPTENPPPGALTTDMAGLTIFEDLLGALRPFLARFRDVYKGIIAAGGPFPTLAPLAAAFHLPQVNLLVRGEAEMVLPAILEALNQGNSEAFFSQEGVFWQLPGVIAISGFDQVNRPQAFDGFKIDLSFLRPGHAAQGLEMNFSRGCRRGCVFCCRVQGNKFRRLPLEKVEKLLEEYKKKIEFLTKASESPRPLSGPPPLVKGVFNQDQSCPIPPLSRGDKGGISSSLTNQSFPQPHAGQLSYSININDDDILQDPAYAREIFAMLKKNGLRIYGIQTSPASLVKSDNSPREEALELAADPGLFVDGRPLLWLGSDVFLPERARRLGKRLPSPADLARLLEEFEKRGLRHFHYWISSDNDSTWEEFVEELSLIFGFFRDFPGFGLLAHAPFIVPYPASRLFQGLSANDPRLKLKLSLDAPDTRFSYKVVDRLETKYLQLNNLLKNEKTGGTAGFFDFLKEKDFIAAAQLAYHFLKQEQLQSPANNQSLIRARERLEKDIGELLELSDK